MKIWVDADACPGVIKEILYRAADRTEIEVTLLANQHLKIPVSKHIRFLKVKSGFDVADNEIVKLVQEGDLVVTADIPLAAEVVNKGAKALNPRGDLYTDNNIQQRFNMRNFMETLRESGVQTGGPASLSQRDRQAFGNNLDQILSAYLTDRRNKQNT